MLSAQSCDENACDPGGSANFQATLSSTTSATVYRQKSYASDDIDRALLRATSLRTTLKGFGIFWRSKGNYHNKEELWLCSFPCERIRFFLSHSWAANGTLKFLTCLLHSEMWSAAISFILAVVVIFFLITVDVFPHLGYYEATIANSNYRVPLTIWFSCFPPIVALVVLFVSPLLTCSFRNTPVFLDMLCIHQVNEELKMNGITSLAGFLANSDTFLMLWSEQYFSRLWCVFEIAAFRRYRPDGKLIIRPISIVFAQCVGFISVWFITNLSVYVVAMFALGSNYLLFVMVSCCFPTLCVSQKLLRALMRDKFALRSQLLAFDCRRAACFAADDRDYIMTSIRRWFGDETSFNIHVRGPIREMLERDMFACPISYCASSVVALPLSCSLLDFLFSFYRAGLPVNDLVSVALGFATIAFCIWPMSVWSVYYLAERFCLPRKSYVADIGLNMTLSACTSFGAVTLFAFASLTYRRHIAVVFLFGAFVAILTWVVFRTYPKYRATNIDAWFSKVYTIKCNSHTPFDDDAQRLGANTDICAITDSNSPTAFGTESTNIEKNMEVMAHCTSESSMDQNGALARKFSL